MTHLPPMPEEKLDHVPVGDCIDLMQSMAETPAMLVFVAQRHPAARLALMDDPFKLRLPEGTWVRAKLAESS